jgi:Domain of Unknown Function (DUF1080)
MSRLFPRVSMSVGLLVSSQAFVVACSSGSPASAEPPGTAGSPSIAGHSGALGSAGAGIIAGAGGVSAAGSAAVEGAGSGQAGASAGTSGAGGALDAPGGAGAGGAGGTTTSTGGTGGRGGPILSVCPNCVSLFDGTTLNGWTQVPAASWSVVNGAMHSLGTARGFIHTTNTYGDFRFIFTSRLIKDPANHFPCVLFWGNSPTKDALTAIQIQPPNGYMWDYRTTGPTANKSPDMFEKRFSHPGFVDTQWSQCEMLANQAAGTLRFACCQLTGTTPCKASEVVDFTDANAGLKAPLALQVHNASMIEEFKDLYVESPVAAPSALLTTN